jgi:hypothetical protein
LAEVHLPNEMTWGLVTAMQAELQAKIAEETSSTGKRWREVTGDLLQSIPRDCTIAAVDRHDL